MALNRETLQYTFEIDTKDAQSGVSGLTKEFYRLRDASGKFATPAQVELYGALRQTKIELDKQASAGKDVSKEYLKLAEDTKKLEESLGGVSAPVLSGASAISTFGSSIANVSTAIDASLNSIYAFLEIVNKLTDPAQIQRLSNILLVLSKISSFKGFGKVSDALGSASNSLDSYNKILIENGFEFEKMTDKVDRYAETIRTLEEVMQNAAIVAISSAASFAVATAKNASTWLSVRKAAKEASIGINAVSDSISLMKKETIIAGNVMQKSLPIFTERLSEAASKDFSKLSNNVNSSLLDIRKNIKIASSEIVLFRQVVTFASKDISIQFDGMKKSVDIFYGTFSKVFISSPRQAAGFADAIYKMSLPRVLGDIRQSIVYVEDAYGSLISTSTAWINLRPANTFDKLLYSINNFVKIFDTISPKISTSIRSSSNFFEVFTKGFNNISYSISEAQYSFTNLFSSINKNFVLFQVGMQNARAASLSYFETLRRGMIGIDTDDFIQQFKNLSYSILNIFKTLAISIASIVSSIFASSNIITEVKNISESMKRVFTTSGLPDAIGKFGESLKTLGLSAKNAGKTMVDAFINFGKAIPTTISQIAALTSSFVNTGKEGIKLGKIIASTHVTPGILAAAEAASIFSGGMVGLGYILSQTDSTLLKVSGTLLVIAGILSGGFAAAFSLALSSVGSFFNKIGSYLATTMVEFEQKFQKAQVVMANFNFTMEGFTKAFGSQAVGTIAEWTAVVEQISSTTVIAADDARKMVTEIVQVGAQLGMTKDEMIALSQIVPDYVSAGESAYDTTVRLLNALAGNSQSVVQYGLHITDASVEHAKFAEKLGLTMSALSENEKVHARLAAIMEQSIPITGRAAAQTGTIIGAQEMLNKQLLEAQKLMGEQNKLIQMWYVGLAKATESLLQLPTPLWKFLGTMQDVLAVSLKLIGTLLSFAIPLAALAGLWNILNIALAKNAVAQGIATTAMMLMGKAVGVQTIAVTSLNAVLINTAIITKGILIYSLNTLGATLVALSSKVWAFTASILANPLFWKAAAIAASIYLVFQAFKQIENETKIFSTLIEQFKYIFQGFTDLFKGSGDVISSFSNILKNVLGKAIDATVIAISLLINGIYGIIGAFSKFMQVITASAELQSFWGAIADESANKIETFNKPLAKATERLFTFSSNAYAASEASQVMGNNIEVATSNLSGLSKELISASEKALITAQVLGKPVEQLMISKKVASEKLLLTKEAEEKKNIAKELFRIDAEILKVSRDATDSSLKALDELKIRQLERINTIQSIREAGQLKLRQALSPIKESLQNLAFLPETESTKKAIIELGNQAAEIIKSINQDTTDKLKSLMREQVDAVLNARTEIAKIRQDETAQVLVELEKQRVGFERLRQDGKLTAQQFKELSDSLGVTKEMRLLAPMPSGFESTMQFAQQVQEQLTTEGLSQLAIERMKLDTTLDNLTIMEQQVKTQLSMAKTTEVQIELMERLGKIAKARGTIEDGISKNIEKSNTEIAQRQESTLSKVANGLEAVKGGAMGIASAITSKFGVIGQIVNAVIQIFGKSKEEFRNFIRGIFQLAQDLPTMIAENIPILLEEIISNLPTAIMKAVKSIVPSTIGLLSGIIKAIAKTLPAVLKQIFSSEFWKEVVYGFLQAFRDAIYSIGDSLASLFSGDSIFDGLGETLSNIDISKSLTGVADQLFGVLDISQGAKGLDDADRIGKAIRDSTKWGVNILMKAWQAMKQAFMWVYNTFFAPWVELTKVAWKYIYDTFLSPFLDMLNIVWTFINDTVLSPFIDLLKIVWNFVYKTVLSPFIDAIKLVWNFVKVTVIDPFVATFYAIGDFFATVFDDPIAAFEGLIEDFFTIFGNIIDDLGNWVEDAYASISKWGNAIVEGIKTAVSDTWDWFVGLGGRLWSAVVTAAQSSWQWLLDAGAKLWQGFISLFKAETWASFGESIKKVFVSVFDGLGDVFKRLGGKIWEGLEELLNKAGNFFKRLFTFDGGGKGAVENFLGFDFPFLAFAEGGYVPGKAKVPGNSLLNDIIPALLSPGEVVLPRELLAKDEFLRQYVDAILGKGGVYPMADGFLGKLTSGAKKIGKAVASPVTNTVAVVTGKKSIGEAISDTIKDTVTPVMDIAAPIIPPQIRELFDSISRFISNIDILEMVKDPGGTLSRAIRGAIDIFQPQFRKMMHFANGGPVGTDTVPAMLTPGEFVVNRRAAAMLGQPLLERLNNGQAPATNQSIVVNLNIKTEQPIDESFVRSKLMPTVREELRRASLDGRRILAPQGVR